VSVALAALAWIGAGLGVVLLAVVLVPFGARADGRVSDAAIEGAVELRWLFGLVAVRVASGGRGGFYLLGFRVSRPRASGSSGERERKRKAGRRKPSAKKKRGLGWLVRSRRALMGAARRLLAATGFRLKLSGRLGLGDPAETAVLVPLVAQLGRLPGVSLELGWDWIEEVIDLEARARARIWLAELLVVGVGLLLDREVRRMLRAR
jgi:hypothetical protein